MKRTGISSQVVTETQTVKPYRNEVKINSLRVCGTQSLVLGALGFVAAVTALFLTTWTIGVLAAMPIVGLAYPWLREAYSAHIIQSKYGKMQQNTLEIEIEQQRRVLADLNNDGVIDSTDQAIQDEQDLGLFVLKVVNVGEPMTRRHWEKRYGWRHERWQQAVNACRSSGILETTTSVRGAVRPKRMLVNTATAGLTALENAGYFVETKASDYLPSTGVSIKNHANPVASERYEGPVTSMQN